MAFLILGVIIYWLVKIYEELTFGKINRLIEENRQDMMKRWERNE